MNSLVSILIPNFNKALFLSETLDSIVNQTYPNWECIIVDDHSTDESWEILTKFSLEDSRFRIFKRPGNLIKGANSCRNFAFKNAVGKLINWFDSDDVMDKNFLAFKVKYLMQNENLDFVFGLIKPLDPNHQSYSFFNLDYTSSDTLNFALDFLKGTYWIQTGSPLFRISFLKKFKYHFHENLFRGQEAEFFSRILLTKPNFRFVCNSIVFWRISNNSITSNYLKSDNESKIRLSWPSTKLIISSFYESRALNTEAKIYFDIRLRHYLKYSNPFSMLMLDVLYVGFRLGIFRNHLLILKVTFYKHWKFIKSKFIKFS